MEFVECKSKKDFIEMFLWDFISKVLKLFLFLVSVIIVNLIIREDILEYLIMKCSWLLYYNLFFKF